MNGARLCKSGQVGGDGQIYGIRAIGVRLGKSGQVGGGGQAWYTQRSQLDWVPKLIPKPLKEKIKYEASELNFLKRSSRAKLPL